VQTYQRIPKLCDELIEKGGGKWVLARGAGDAGKGNLFQTFDDFETGLWDVLVKVGRHALVLSAYN
jgi:cytochrome P450/NADPH-cytochrome P450 reductase